MQWNPVGTRLRQAREIRRLKQIQVQAHTGINNKTLSGYERGVSEPDFATLRILADFYEVNFDWLLGKTDDHQVSPARSFKNNKVELADAEILKELQITLDGQELTDDEAAEIIKYIRVTRQMKNNK